MKFHNIIKTCLLKVKIKLYLKSKFNRTFQYIYIYNFHKNFKHKICTIPLESFLFTFLFNDLTCFTIFKKIRNLSF